MLWGPVPSLDRHLPRLTNGQEVELSKERACVIRDSNSTYQPTGSCFV